MIEIRNVSKKFRIWEDRSRDLKETAINLLKGKRRSYRDLWALRGINLEIREGETVAFIGENGSGKSTLLKLLCGIYIPDGGEILTNGRVSALLELGVGFHPDLTGEENIYLNGAMLGFNRRQMRERFDNIVDFSEIGDFIYSPIRTYSSGMAMRLGFSIAMCVDPDILLIDEVLAVGDEAFQEKCIDRLEEFKKAGKTIILVTHGLEMVEKFCGRAVLLHEGKMVVDGIPEKSIDEYHALLSLRMGKHDFKGAENGEEEGGVRVPVNGGPPPIEEEEGIASPVRKDFERVEAVVEGRAPDEEGQVNFDPERFRMIEVQDPLFFVGDLFFKAFGQSPPTTPTNYVAIHGDPKDPSAFHVIGFIHVEQMDEVGLVGGVCIDRPWQGKGLAKELLSFIDHDSSRFKALFGYTNDSRLYIQCGYEGLDHPHLMVKWLKPLSSEEKKSLIKAATEIGPF